MPEFPDWLRGLALIGKAGTDYVVIKVKSTGELYTLIQGEYAGTPLTIAVDADGNMLAVLKGQFGGDLVTVKVDEDGRLYSYVTDDIDQWGNILPGGFAELAARLGSMAAYERRGQVVFTDSFEYGMGDWTASGSAGYTAALDPTTFIHGGYSVHLKTHTDDGDNVQLLRDFGGFPADVGVGAAFWAKFATVGDQFEVGVIVSDATNSYGGRIKGEVADSKLYYVNSGGGYTELGTWDPAPAFPDYFKFLKVAIDPSTSKYLYAVIDGQQFDMSAVGCLVASATDRRYQGFFNCEASAGSFFEVYLDSFVLTTKETGYQIT
jgi:hypothetical protein